MRPQARAKAVWLAAPFLTLFFCAPALAQNSVRAPAQAQVPMKMQEMQSPAEAKPAAGAAAHKAKFPNVDTAKNRQDYEMGTDFGAKDITVGRDETSGDSVMGYTPPKKAQQRPADPPIDVKVLVPGGRYTGAGS